MKITSIEPQKKSSKGRSASGRNPKRFNVFLDGQFAFGADEDLVVSHRLIPGKIVQPRGLHTILFEVEMGKLMERVYGLFSVRARSEKEVRDYLKDLSFRRKIKDREELSVLIIDLLVERLKQKGMINDLEFAKAWVEGRRKSKQKGIRALKAELMQKGVSREIVEEVISHQPSAVSEEALASQALEKKMKSWKNLPPQEFKKKATGFLLRHGFDYDVVQTAVENVLKKE